MAGSVGNLAMQARANQIPVKNKPGNKTMSNAASHAHAFYRQVAEQRKVYTIRDEGGFPAPKNREGIRSQPFWSSASRAQRIIKNVPAYAGFEVYEISWEDFRDRWLPGIKQDGELVGVNWSGSHATGYDLKPDFVRRAIEIRIKELDSA